MGLVLGRRGCDRRLRLVLNDDLLATGRATTCQRIAARCGGRDDVCVLNLDLFNLRELGYGWGQVDG